MTDQVNADWTELQVTIPAADTDRAGDIAQMVVPYGIYIEDYSHLEEEAMEIAHIDLIDEDLLKKDRTKSIIHVYISPEENPAEAISFLKERFEAVGIENTITAANCAEEDWINNWKKYFKPIPVGNRLLVRPMWEDEYEAGDRVVLHLEPGLAFGTGTHETTSLCIRLMDDYLAPGEKVLDVGCGSGILSIAGALLGASEVLGVEIDPDAVTIAKENIALNHVDGVASAQYGDLTKGIDFQADVIVANLMADLVVMLSKDVAKHLRPGGRYISSGILVEKMPEVVDAMRALGFAILEVKEDGMWCAIVAKR